MTDTYTEHAEICARFYECTADQEPVSDFLRKIVQPTPKAKCLFVGGMFHIVAALSEAGLDLTCIDYTEEMVAFGKQRLPNGRILKADLTDLPFEQEFDVLFVVGRVFTHMISESDLQSAFISCNRALRHSGKLLADNYEDTRIRETSYFNGTIEAASKGFQVTRVSTTNLRSASPFVVHWSAEYSGKLHGKDFKFEDSMPHLAFSRSEFAGHIQTNGFNLLSQGDNFDETSFFTLAQKAV